jgi:hypothetical protein
MPATPTVNGTISGMQHAAQAIAPATANRAAFFFVKTSNFKSLF